MLSSEHHQEEAFSSSEANTAPQAEETVKDEDNGCELRKGWFEQTQPHRQRRLLRMKTMGVN